MPYIPKYSTGETLEANGLGEGQGYEGDRVIIIGTRQLISKYSEWVDVTPSTDGSDAEHTYYGTFSITRQTTWWYWEKDLEISCINTERGKRELLLQPNIIRIIKEAYNMSRLQLENFNTEQNMGMVIN